MRTGYKGTFVVAWSQTNVDGLFDPPKAALAVGSAWSWRGEAVCVDGPGSVLRLDEADGDADLRNRAARAVRRLVGAALAPDRAQDIDAIEHPLQEQGLLLTDGRESYTATLIEIGGNTPPLLMFLDGTPPRDREFWVVHETISLTSGPAPGQVTSGGVICFTPGTRIRTAEGAVPVEMLREGDRIQTKDNGCQEIHWIGSRRMTGARLFALPQLRPVRIHAGAFGIERPDDEFLVSPEHRLLVRGAVAQSLFNTDEVLVAARDLVNGQTVSIDTAAREVTYVHLLLAQHEVVFANGVETESFHPGNAALDSLGDAARGRLEALLPWVARDPMRYGRHARRNLTRSEAAILNFDAA